MSGTNFDDRASWLSAGCQPLARTTSLPLPTSFSMMAASPFSNRASTRDSPSRSRIDAPIFPEADLGEIVELSAGQRREQRMIEGDLAEHHVTTPDRRFLDVPGRHAGQGGERLGPTRSGDHIENGATFVHILSQARGRFAASRPPRSPVPGAFFEFQSSVSEGLWARMRTVCRGLSRKTRSQVIEQTVGIVAAIGADVQRR